MLFTFFKPSVQNLVKVTQPTGSYFSSFQHFQPVDLIKERNLLHENVQSNQVYEVDDKTNVVHVPSKLLPLIA